MSTLELANKLELCLKAQVQVIKERDALVEIVQMYLDTAKHEALDLVDIDTLARAALAKARA